MLLAEHDELVEALVLDGLDEPFDVGVHVGGTESHRLELYSSFRQHVAKFGNVFDVSIPQHDLDSQAFLPGIFQECPRLVLHPDDACLERAGREIDLPRRHVNERQEEDLADTAGCNDVSLDEVALPQGLSMGFEEGAPVALRRIELRIELVLSQDVDHGAARHLQPELAKLTEDARIT